MTFSQQFAQALAIDTKVAAANATAKVKTGQTFPVTNSAGGGSQTATATVNANTKALSAKLPSTVALVASGAALTVPVTGTYATKATPTVVNGVITGIVLS